jgi:hypothetical protein
MQSPNRVVTPRQPSSPWSSLIRHWSFRASGLLTALPSLVLAWSNPCESLTNAPWAAVTAGNTSFAGAGKSWSANGTNVLVCSADTTAEHAQAQGPRNAAAYSSDWSNAWAFKIKFVGGNNADKLDQVFFQVFEQVNSSYYEPVLMAIRRPSGQVILRLVHQANNASGQDYPADDQEIVVGTAAFDTWYQVKVEGRFNTVPTTGRVRAALVALGQNVDTALAATPYFYSNILYKGALASKTYCFWGTYTFPVNYSGPFVGTVNVEDVWQQFASWGM